MTVRSSTRPSHRLVSVIASFSVVAGLGAAITISQSSATPFEPVPRAELGPNLIDNPGFAEGMTSWAARAGDGPAIKIVSPGYENSAHALRMAPNHSSDVMLRDDRDTAPASTSNEVYQATVYLKATNKPVNVVWRLLEWKNDAIANVTRSTFRVGTAKWDRVGLIAPAATDGGRLQVTLEALNLGADNGLTVDRFRLHRIKGADATSTPTPDPTTSSPSPTTSSSPTPTTSSTPTPSNTETPTPDPSNSSSGNTLFGASIYEDGQSWTDAVADAHKNYGGLEVVRVFNPGLPQPWSGRPGQTGGPIVTSFKADPAKVIAGDYDDLFTNWFQTAPTKLRTWWTYYHEPEDDVEQGQMSSQAWRDAYHHIAELADAVGNPKLVNTVILMCWTLNPRSHRTFANYYPGSDVVEALAFDCYNPPQNTDSYISPASLFGAAAAKAKELGVQFGIAEVGSVRVKGDTDGSGRAAWLRAVATYAQSQGATFVSYWDALAGNNDYRLTDEASRAAWYDVVNNY